MAEIDVLLPNYNGAKYLEESLLSLVNQNFSDWRLIFIDDGSTDNSLELVHRIIPASKLLVVQAKENLGISQALNTGIKHVNGRFTARMDADDVCVEGRLLNQMTLLRSRKDLNAVGSPIQKIDILGNPIHRSYSYRSLNPKEVNLLLSITNVISHPTTFFRSESLIEIEFSQTQAEDYFAWLSNHSELKWQIIDQPLVRWRKHDKNLSGSRYRFDMNFQNYRKEILEHHNFEISENLLSFLNCEINLITPNLRREIDAFRSQLLSYSSRREFRIAACYALDSVILENFRLSSYRVKVNKLRNLQKQSIVHRLLTILMLIE